MSWAPAVASIVGGVLSYMGARKSAKAAQALGNRTTTVVNMPPAFQIPYIKRVFSEAEKQFEAPGSIVAGFTPDQLVGQALARYAALNVIPQQLDQAAGSLGFLLDPAMLDPNSNPYLAGAVQATVSPLYENLVRNVLPSITSGAVATGNVGSSRQGIAQGLAISETQRRAGDATSRLLAQTYSEGLRRMLGGLQLAPSIIGLNLLPAETLSQIGLQQQKQRQAELDEPFTRLQRFASFVRNPVGSTGTRVGPPLPSPNPVLSGIGGALAGFQLYKQFSDLFSTKGSGGEGGYDPYDDFYYGE